LLVANEPAEVDRAEDHVDQYLRIDVLSELAGRLGALDHLGGAGAALALVAVAVLLEDAGLALPFGEDLRRHLAGEPVESPDKLPHQAAEDLLSVTGAGGRQVLGDALVEHGHDEGGLGRPPLVDRRLADPGS